MLGWEDRRGWWAEWGCSCDPRFAVPGSFFNAFAWNLCFIWNQLEPEFSSAVAVKVPVKSWRSSTGWVTVCTEPSTPTGMTLQAQSQPALGSGDVTGGGAAPLGVLSFFICRCETHGGKPWPHRPCFMFGTGKNEGSCDCFQFRLFKSSICFWIRLYIVYFWPRMSLSVLMISAFWLSCCSLCFSPASGACFHLVPDLCLCGTS